MAMWLQRALVRLQQLGAIGSGSREERLRRATLLLLSLITCLAGALWGLTYWLLGLHQVALVPFAYTFIVLFSIIGFIVSERFDLFAWTQLSLLLLLPYVCQWMIGGFVPAGGVMLWSLLAPIGAFVFLGAAKGWAWFGVHALLATGSLVYDLLFRPPGLPAASVVGSGGVALVLAILNVVAVSAVIFALVAYALAELRREQASVERLLRNVLPGPIAERMRAGETAIADSFEEVTILFADLVGFTRLAAGYPADNVVGLLNRIFSAFDELAEQWDVEKIKTIGDAYMLGSGLPVARHDHAAVVAEVALAMREVVERIARERGLVLELRIGIHTGPVVAGIIGLRKFAYDVWGDTVNVASRMESTAQAGAIQVSERTGRRLAPLYVLETREPVAVRGLGELTTLVLKGRRPDRPEGAFPTPRAGVQGKVVELARAVGG
ncbi:MAG TPA: adenylate/guanylate cyclase domain-containing protein [Geminicoccaceae bacterium]|nr:adenylate/guanylate cyclase domain-containing protein [Geminicoccaceae bacterium]